MLALWFLQIIFLNTYYEDMKIKETRRLASSIISHYGQDGLFDEIARATRQNDMYIQIEARMDGSDILLYSTYNDVSTVSDAGGGAVEETRPIPFPVYRKEIQSIREKLVGGDGHDVSSIIANPMRDNNMLAYCAYLDMTEGHEVLLYIFSPLYPVESTISILAQQLNYVTVISLLVAFFISFYISRQVTRPLTNITNLAAQLAEGRYGIVFEGGHYSEIMRLADTLTYTSSELARADNMQKDLIANVSHDLRTPLTMVKSYAEMIRDISGDAPERRNEHLQVIIDEADRLSFLVNDLLELSRMQSGRYPLAIASFPLRGCIENVLNSYSIFAEQEGFRLDFSANGEGVVAGDEGKIKQVLSNLITNAIKFSGDGRLVEVHMDERAGHVYCSVTDHGMGIQKKDLKNIWQRYYRASSDYLRPDEGTGLGLSIVKEILTLHGARFGVDSEVGRGSTFWFELRA
jgi:signal transduction histidine kinase